MPYQITSIVLLAIIAFSVLNEGSATTVAPLCKSGIIEEMPPHIRKVCQALENSDQLTTALKSYINNEAASMPIAALVSKADDLVNFGKRTDVDHIFLRFGKRR